MKRPLHHWFLQLVALVLALVTWWFIRRLLLPPL